MAIHREILQRLRNWLMPKPRLLPDKCHYIFGSARTNAALIDSFVEVLRRLQPTVFCDIGAYDGQAAGMIHDILPATTVYAFEANPDVHRNFCGSPHLEGINYENLAICDHDGTISVLAPRSITKMYTSRGVQEGTRIEEPHLTNKSSLRHRTGQTTYTEHRVPARRLDSLFGSRLDAGDSFALWIDVEGALDKVLSGAVEVLQKTLTVFVEVENFDFWRRQAKSAAIARTLQKLGFAAVARDNEYGEYQYNILFVRRSSLPTIQAWLQEQEVASAQCQT